jgi:Tol biopolymer transport system component
VRRWERREGLPVHRHLHDKQGSVYAFQDEIDAWWERRAISNGHGASPGARRRTFSGVHLATAAVAGAILAGLAAMATVSVTSPAAGGDGEYRFSIAPPDAAVIGTSALSPDGRHLAFTASGPDGTTLWIRPLVSVTPRAIPGTDEAAFPFWSADSRFVGFFAGGRLKTVAIAGGDVKTICDAPEGRGGAWNQDDVILFAPDRDGPLFRVPASGGLPVRVTHVDRALHRAHLWPEFLPDGQHFFYLADSTRPEHHAIFAGGLDQSPPKRLIAVESNAAFDGAHVLYMRNRTLLAQRFDTRRLQLNEEVVTVAQPVVRQYGIDHKGDFSASRTGVLTFRSGGTIQTRLNWLDRRGQPAGALDAGDAATTEPVLSPDGSRAAVSVFDADGETLASDLWLLDLVRGGRSRFTFEAAAEFEPVWSPDGTRVAFASSKGGTLDLYEKPSSGTGAEVLLLHTEHPKHPESWSPDGRVLTYASFEEPTKYDVWMLSLDGERKATPYLRSEYSEGQSQISPDGRWVAYTSNESGRLEVYVGAFPVPNGKWQISSDGGADPRWRGDGRELFYISTGGRMMAVDVAPSPAFAAGVPRPLFEINVMDLWQDARNHYDVSRDGARFLVASPVENTKRLPLTVVVNWQGSRPEQRPAREGRTLVPGATP